MQIPRGADLTEADLAVLAADMQDICHWAMRVGIRRQQGRDEMRKALEARLGRRPMAQQGGAR